MKKRMFYLLACFSITTIPIHAWAYASWDFNNVALSSSGTPGLVLTSSAWLPKEGTLVLGLQYRGFEQARSNFVLNNIHDASFHVWYRIHRYMSVFNTLQTTHSNKGYHGLRLSPGLTLSIQHQQWFFALTGQALLPPATDNSTYRVKSFGAHIQAVVSYVWELQEHRSLALHGNAGFDINNTSHSYQKEAHRTPFIRAGYHIADSNALTLAAALEYRVHQWRTGLEINSALSTEQWDASNTTLTPSLSYSLPLGFTPWVGFTARISSAYTLQNLPPWQATLGITWSMAPSEPCCCCQPTTAQPVLAAAPVSLPPAPAPVKEAITHFTGTVSNEEGQPINAQIRFLQPETETAVEVSQGHFAFSKKPGTYQIQCYAEGYIPTQASLNGAQDGTSHYPIVLKKTANRVVIKNNTISFNEPILFDSGKSSILSSSLPVADEILAILLQHPTMHILMEGHTDNTGKPLKNKVLSLARVNAVKAYLVQQGVKETRIETLGHGPSKPIQSNKTAKGRAANRRVEIKITHQ